MKLKKAWRFVALLALVSTITSFKSAKDNNSSKGFAVIELFTSEGCSSCPPADAVIAKIEQESAGQPIYILAFHVDYWDRMGWKDTFSSADYTRRQYQYKNWLHIQSVYTPQAVVNGRTELVASEEGVLRNAMNNCLKKDASAQISLSDLTTGPNKASLQYHVQGAAANTGLLVALVQKSAQSKVERGENAGRTLTHVQIVRSLQTLQLKQNNGVISVNLPKNFDAQQYELIAFLQNQADGAITAATKAVF